MIETPLESTLGRRNIEQGHDWTILSLCQRSVSVAGRTPTTGIYSLTAGIGMKDLLARIVCEDS